MPLEDLRAICTVAAPMDEKRDIFIAEDIDGMLQRIPKTGLLRKVRWGMYCKTVAGGKPSRAKVRLFTLHKDGELDAVLMVSIFTSAHNAL